jgi:hypothetical protein
MPTLSLPSNAVRKVASSSYTVSVDDELILVTPTAHPTTITLYDASGHDKTGKIVSIRNMNAGSEKLRLVAVGGTVDGLAEYIIEPTQMVTVKSDGTDWWVSSNDDLTHQIKHIGISGSYAIDWELGKNHVVSMSGSTAFTFSGGKPGGHYNLICWRISGGAEASFGGNVVWSGNVSPQQADDAGTVDFFAFYFDGDTYIGAGSLYTILS